MKAVLMSIHPKWCELLVSCHKTAEIRKTKPKLDTPFKVYIYETQDKNYGNVAMCFQINPSSRMHLFIHSIGKVIGEFVCDEIQEVHQCNSGWVQEHACLSRYEFFEYLGIPQGTHFGYDKKAYALHISDLVIYDKPKELSEFYRKCDKFACESCEHLDYEIINDDEFEFEREYFCETNCCIPITRPPRSWCYVENEVSGQ